MTLRQRVPIALLSLSLVLSVPASAHEVSDSRFDAPIPLPLLFAGAAATVALTALLLGALSKPTTGGQARTVTPVGTTGASDATGGRRAAAVGTEAGRTTDGTRQVLGHVPPTVARGVRIGARFVFLLLFLGAVGTGLFGVQAAAENLATTFVWPIWLRGVGLYAILFGSPWRVLSPWQTIYDGLCWLDSHEVSLLGAYPESLGRWPAFISFVALIGVLENLTIVPQSPRMTAAVVAGYAAFMLGGAVIFGSTWLRNADALAVLYDLLGRVAPIRPRRTDSGGYRVVLRAPWRGCTWPLADLSLVAFAIAAVYTVSFDGFTSTPEFQRLLFDTRDALGIGASVSVFLYVVGLVGFVGIFIAVSWTMGLVVDTERNWREITFAFAPTVLPIAAAYEFAHNYPFVVRNLGLLAAQVWSVLTSASVEPVVLLEWLTPMMFWWSLVLLIVAGHIIAVVAAHRVALAHSKSTAQARRMHLPLVVLMIGYTVLSLWIVSRPVVAG